LVITIVVCTANALAGDAFYFSLQASGQLPIAPASFQVQSPTFIMVPAGASLTVYLLRGETVVTTSTLTFENSFNNGSLLPAVPVAAFTPPGMAGSMAQPLSGATLTPGQTDLAAIAAAPDQYRLLWLLSDGVIGRPGQAVMTGATVSFLDLKLVAVSASSGDQKPGSVLFFNRYSSNASNPARGDTTLTLTNTHPASNVFVRLFIISGATCQNIELQLCLAAQQTINLLASDLDPGTSGFAMAIATDAAGQPIQFNWLIGNATVKQPGNSSLYSAVLSAVTIAKRAGGAVANTNGQAELIFDDVNYERLPARIAFDNVQNQANGFNTTSVSLYRPPADLSGAAASASVQITGYGTNDGQVLSSSATMPLSCYGSFNIAALHLSPIQIGTLITAGNTGWFTATAADQLPLLGAQFNAGSFNSGNSARALTLATEYHIRVPVSAVTCPQ
jgi:hypothetical protein